MLILPVLNLGSYITGNRKWQIVQKTFFIWLWNIRMHLPLNMACLTLRNLFLNQIRKPNWEGFMPLELRGYVQLCLANSINFTFATHFKLWKSMKAYRPIVISFSAKPCAEAGKELNRPVSFPLLEYSCSMMLCFCHIAKGASYMFIVWTLTSHWALSWVLCAHSRFSLPALTGFPGTEILENSTELHLIQI